MTERSFVVEVDGKFAVAEVQADGRIVIPSGRFEDRRNAEALVAFENSPLYSVCPACSGGPAFRRPVREGDEVFACSTCGALFGRVESIYDYVEGALRAGVAKWYFDFTQRSTGLRIHGWTDDSLPGRIVQYG